jgi:hypothetical protein
MFSSMSCGYLSLCMYRYNGVDGTHIKVTEFARDKDCLVCGPGTLIELDTSSTLSEVSHKFKNLQNPCRWRGKNYFGEQCPICQTTLYIIPAYASSV